VETARKNRRRDRKTPGKPAETARWIALPMAREDEENLSMEEQL